MSNNRIMHLLSSNIFSGAENVACQIIDMFVGELDMAYASPQGIISKILSEKGINYIPLRTLSIRQVDKAIKSFNPQVIHAHDLKAIVYAVLCHRNVKVVAHIHRNHVKMHKFSLRSILFKFIAKSKNLSSIIWVSDACFNDYVFHSNRIIQKKSIILYNIIDTKKFIECAKNPVEKKYDIIYVGRITEIKNPLRFIDIINGVKSIKPNVSVAIIGNGNLMETCQQKVKELNLCNNIDFLNHISNVAPYYSNSKILLMTSITEGIPMSILEAQVFGLPVVSTYILGLDKIITADTGFFYNTNEDAVKYISNLLNNHSLYNKYKEKIIKFSTLYNDMGKYKNVLMSIY